MKKLIAVILVILLFGCSIVSTRLQSTLAPAANIGDSITCQKGCKVEWERAQFWIAKHSNCMIQLSTDVLIRTFNPPQGEPSYGFSITKEPAGPGRNVIQMQLACGNIFVCDPKPLDVKNAFYYYVKTGVDLLAGQDNMGAIR
jgi:hypothetical protein